MPETNTTIEVTNDHLGNVDRFPCTQAEAVGAMRYLDRHQHIPACALLRIYFNVLRSRGFDLNTMPPPTLPET